MTQINKEQQIKSLRAQIDNISQLIQSLKQDNDEKTAAILTKDLVELEQQLHKLEVAA